MSLYGEIEEWQYANHRERARAYRFRMSLIHKHKHGGENKIGWCTRVISVEIKNISAHMLVIEAHCCFCN